jgi:hypothetical protein
LKFLLDDMYPAAVAVGLRELGVDVLAVQQRPDRRGMADATP